MLSQQLRERKSFFLVRLMWLAHTGMMKTFSRPRVRKKLILQAEQQWALEVFPFLFSVENTVFCINFWLFAPKRCLHPAGSKHCLCL